MFSLWNRIIRLLEYEFDIDRFFDVVTSQNCFVLRQVGCINKYLEVVSQF